MPPSTPILQSLTAAMNSGPAQQLDEARYKPRVQDYFRVSKDEAWQSASAAASSSTSNTGPSFNAKTIRLLSWNIDVLVRFGKERMEAALGYLDQVVSSSPPDVPIVVFLQEMGQFDLEQIRNTQWIKARFNITDVDYKNWLSPLYGTTTLVGRRLKIKTVFRVPWISKFDRDGLFVDIALSNPGGDSNSILRLCNVHLESLVAEPPVRPRQLAAAAKYLHDKDVAGALLAGDCNAIQPFDRTLHSENGLKDTYLELGGQEDTDDGYTWGQQVPQWMKDKFGCSRMDKILITGDVRPVKFERIGMGVKVAENVREEVTKEIEGGYVTDHYGVMGDFELVGGRTLDGGDDEVRSKLS